MEPEEQRCWRMQLVVLCGCKLAAVLNCRGQKHDGALTKCTVSKEFVSVFSTLPDLFGCNLFFSVITPRLMKE